MVGIEKRGKYCHQRIINPKKFDKKSFRTISLGKGKKAIIGCRKSYYKNKKCTIGTEIQSILSKPIKNKCKVGEK